MIIKLDELNIKNKIIIDLDVEKDNHLDSRIIALQKAHVLGSISLNSNSEIKLECVFSGTMIISDSITLNPVPYPFSCHINENLGEIAENYDNAYKKTQNILDLEPILWQNIVLEVPISFTVCKDASLKGNGWELIDEDKKVETIDPRLEKLKELLKGDD